MNERDERVLRDGLRGLARQMEKAESAPLRVEEALLVEFRRRKVQILWKRVAWGASAAVAAAVVALLLIPRPATAPDPPGVVAVGPSQPENPLPKARPVEAPQASVVARRRPVRRAPPVQAGSEPRQESVTGFLPVPGADLEGPFYAGSVVRVELPRTVMASYGIPMNRERMRETVQADVVLGEDGLARAIRFVQ